MTRISPLDDWDDYDVRDDSIIGCGPLHLMFIYYFFCFPASLAQEGKDYRDKGRGHDRRLLLG